MTPWTSMILGRGGRGLLSSKSYLDVPARPGKSDFSLYQFFAHVPTHQYTIFERKYPILTKLGAFYNNLPKIHLVYKILVPLSLMKNLPITIPNFTKKHPKRQAHVCIPCQCENRLSLIPPSCNLNAPHSPGDDRPLLLPVNLNK